MRFEGEANGGECAVKVLLYPAPAGFFYSGRYEMPRLIEVVRDAATAVPGSVREGIAATPAGVVTVKVYLLGLPLSEWGALMYFVYAAILAFYALRTKLWPLLKGLARRVRR